MKHVYIGLSFWLSCLGLTTQAQQLNDWPVNDQFFYTVNPAYAAIVPSLTAGISHARKWQRLQSSPTQSMLGLMMPFNNERMGLGGQLFSEETGPFRVNGMQLSYGYRIPLHQFRQNQLSLGMSIRLMHIAFDQDHFIAADQDNLLTDVEGNRFVPPSLTVGFHYQTGEPYYADPVQLEIAGSAARFLPFQSRFNTLSFDRPFQWYGLFGLNIWASDQVTISPALFFSDIERTGLNYALRIKAAYGSLGWAMTQYSKAGFLVTQLGFNIGGGWTTDDAISVSASNSWNFGSLSDQVGNSLTFGLVYQKAIDYRPY